MCSYNGVCIAIMAVEGVVCVAIMAVQGGIRL